MHATRRARTAARRGKRLVAAAASAALVASLVALGVPAFVQSPSIAPAANAVEQPIAADPAEPSVLWTEGFETGTGNAPSQLGAYRSSIYRADAFWLNYADCNGVIVNYASTYPNGNQYCVLPDDRSTQARDSRFKVARMADVLGQVAAKTVGGTTDTSPVNGSTATTRSNHAVTAMTSTAASTSTDLVVFESRSAIGLSRAGYYVASIDVAEDSCAARPGGMNNNSRLDYALLVGSAGTVKALTAAPIIACNVTGGRYTSPVFAADVQNDPWGTGSPSTRAGTFWTDSSALLTAAEAQSARIRLTNEISQKNGNDFSFDNLRVLDATPQLTKAFADETVNTGDATTLTFTVTNTAERASKLDWGFTDTLPGGLKPVANSFGGTCVNTAGTAAFNRSVNIGAGTITISGGDLPRGAASCTITVSVNAASAGAYTNGAANISGTTLKAPLDATLTVVEPATISVRHVLQRAAGSDQFTTSLLQGATVVAESTTSGSTGGLQAQAIVGQRVAPGADLTLHTEPVSGAGLNYATTYSCERAGVVIASGQAGSGSITMPDEAGASVVCTFTTAPRTAQYHCDPHHFYSVSENGELVQGDIVTGRIDVLRAGASGVTGINALAVAPNGSSIWGLGRSGSDAGDVSYIAKGTADGALSTVAGAYTPVDRSGARVPGGIVAGAIDLDSGRYLFGKFNGGSFYLWSFTESTRQFAFVGSFPTGSASVGNGDMAFDAKGNLSVLGAASSGTSSTATLFTITKQNLANPSAGVLAVGSSVAATLTGSDAAGFPNVNGLAFSPRGTVYLSNASGTHEYDPTTWKRVAGTMFVASGSVDLASCSGPSTITVQKNVVGRADRDKKDQFTIGLLNGSTTTAVATTSGSENGRQREQIGPYPAPIGSTLTISESMAKDSPSLLGAYTSRYECWTDGERVLEGSATSASVTIPNRYGAAVNCTFFNAPKPATTVIVRKAVLDPASGAPVATAGWTVGATAAATAGTATMLPSETPQQRTDATGAATWAVLFSTDGVATVTVSEVQQSGFDVVAVRCSVNGVVTDHPAATSVSLPGIVPSSSIDCTFTNRPVATLTLVERIGYGTVAAGAWTLSATGPSSAITGPTGATGQSAVTNRTVSSGIAYRLAEKGGPAAYQQAGPWTCVDGSGASVPITADGDVTLPQGAAVTCTVVNSTAGLTILKTVQEAQRGFEAKDWTITATPDAFSGLAAQSRVGAEFSSAGNAASTVEVRPGHAYTLTEALTDQGSTIAYRQIALERLVGTSWVAVGSASITAPAAGQTAVYRFVNAPIPGAVLPLTGGMSTDAFVVAGALILLLALSLSVLHGRRRRRRSTA